MEAVKWKHRKKNPYTKRYHTATSYEINGKRYYVGSSYRINGKAVRNMTLAKLKKIFPGLTVSPFVKTTEWFPL